MIDATQDLDTCDIKSSQEDVEQAMHHCATCKATVEADEEKFRDSFSRIPHTVQGESGYIFLGGLGLPMLSWSTLEGFLRSPVSSHDLMRRNSHRCDDELCYDPILKRILMQNPSQLLAHVLRSTIARNGTREKERKRKCSSKTSAVTTAELIGRRYSLRGARAVKG